MGFKLSSRSIDRLGGIDAGLITVVNTAIDMTKVDFGVTCGMRTLAEQEALVAKGASQTMKSKHLEGRAVDLVAYVGSNVTWALNMYDEIADAMADAARIDYVEGVEDEDTSEERMYAIRENKARKILDNIKKNKKPDLEDLEASLPTQEVEAMPTEVEEEKPQGLMARPERAM